MSLHSQKFLTLNIVDHSFLTSHTFSLSLLFLLCTLHFRHLHLIIFLVAFFLSSDDLTFSSSTFMMKNIYKVFKIV